MVKAIKDGFRMSAKQAIGEILFVLFIFAFFFVLIYVWDIQEPTKDPAIWNQYKSSTARGH